MRDQHHGALARAAMIVGGGCTCIGTVPGDSVFRLDLNALARAAVVMASTCPRGQSSGQHDHRPRSPEGHEAKDNVAGPSGRNSPANARPRRHALASVRRPGPSRARLEACSMKSQNAGLQGERLRNAATIGMMPGPLHRGNVDDPVRNSSTARAHCRPSRMAQTTSD